MSFNLPYNMNRDEKLVVNTESLEWIDSPSAKVKRKQLEREKEESGQVTSIVEYKPGAKFAQHSHPLGEEIFVISGEFADESGRYPAGTYIRNPPGSAHSPFSEKGCVLFVKLNQFLSQDSERVVVESEKLNWQQGHGSLKVKPLHSIEGRGTALVLWPIAAKFQKHSHWGGEEIFVLSGTFQDEFSDYPKGTWIRSPHLSEHNPFSEEGCLILVKTGHI
jgi:anti-sigma factor ChrR (cupin superfamily)